MCQCDPRKRTPFCPNCPDYEKYKPKPVTLEDCKNEDGTYNGYKAMAIMTGFSEEKVRDMAKRIFALKKDGKNRDEIKKIIDSEFPIETLK